jgi:hypothetical protein
MEEWQGGRTIDPAFKRKQVRAASSRYAAKRAAEGLVRIAVWVPDADADLVRDYAAKLVQEAQKLREELV